MAARDDTTELRMDLSNDVVTWLDAISLAQRIQRNQLVHRILLEWADQRHREHMMASRLRAGNPLAPEGGGRESA